MPKLIKVYAVDDDMSINVRSVEIPVDSIYWRSEKSSRISATEVRGTHVYTKFSEAKASAIACANDLIATLKLDIKQIRSTPKSKIHHTKYED
jgi:hypothetical protein